MDKNNLATKYSDILLGFIYAFIVFFEVMSLSSWHYLHSGFDSPNSKIIVSAFILIFIIGFLKNVKVLNLIIVSLLMALAAFYYIRYHEVGYFIMLLLALCAGMSMDFRQILKIDCTVRIVTILFIAFLSFINFLPIDGNNSSITGSYFTKFVYGFSYPNQLGYLIMIIGIEFVFVCNSMKLNRKFLVLAIAMAAEFYLDYLTGLLGILLFMFLYLWLSLPKYGTNKGNIIILLCLLLIPFFVFISIYVSTKYSSTDPLWNKLNQLMSLRFPIWQYYYNGWGPNLFGNFIDVGSKTIGVVGYGAFDGAFLFFLLKFGAFSLFLIWILVLTVFLTKKEVDNKIALASLLLIIVITGIPETLGFVVAYSSLFSLIGSYLFGENKNINQATIGLREQN
ncbi:hypothetical protein [Oenococcus sicerae]|uniref:Polysaccharide polymerase n=1 Tax=Oenococcus sicerae TaxID=2203724 RepID=A0AAJ1R9M9_9LACO|nr:hypothetical protein [Oenococcus sicerae]MDN6900648.1 hypothetical protein [Oenococcus sicerae]